MEAVKVGKRGTIIVPSKLRKRYGIEEGTLVTAEAREDGVLIRPAVVLPVERYTPERKAEFLLSTATTEQDYQRARKEVKKLGVDPDTIPTGGLDKWTVCFSTPMFFSLRPTAPRRAFFNSGNLRM
jgi:AbrB family looped-hinge helix DNA binding protein